MEKNKEYRLGDFFSEYWWAVILALVIIFSLVYINLRDESNSHKICVEEKILATYDITDTPNLDIGDLDYNEEYTFVKVSNDKIQFYTCENWESAEEYCPKHLDDRRCVCTPKVISRDAEEYLDRRTYFCVLNSRYPLIPPLVDNFIFNDSCIERRSSRNVNDIEWAKELILKYQKDSNKCVKNEDWKFSWDISKEKKCIQYQRKLRIINDTSECDVANNVVVFHLKSDENISSFLIGCEYDECMRWEE